MTFVRFRFFCAAAAVSLSAFAAAGCGGGGQTRPIPGPTLSSAVSPSPSGPSKATATPAASATPKPSAIPTASPGANGFATVAPAVLASDAGTVETMYQRLPHTSTASDLSALASQMVSSGQYRTAAVMPGGITATLPNGTPLLFFADRKEDLASGASTSLRTSVRTRSDFPLSAANAHEIAFLINETDTNAFTPAHQAIFASTFQAAGFTSANGYGVDDEDVTLENIIALGSGHPIDFLDISTHGTVVAPLGSTNPTEVQYVWLSSTPPSASPGPYDADIAAGRLFYGVTLVLHDNDMGHLAHLAFTPQWLTSHLTFNTGAIVDNQACLGQNQLIASSVQGILHAAGVGRYLAWTKSVGAVDSDETDAFLFDRLLGEQNSAQSDLDALVPSMTPPQRGFPLDRVQGAMASETRDTNLQPAQSISYTTSNVPSNAAYPPAADGPMANLVISDFGDESLASAPLAYTLPSIATMAVTENAANGTLTIDGAFPAATGNVSIADASGTYTVAPQAWSATQVSILLPSSGNGSSGNVTVFSAEGIPSNVVPLTKWTGKLDLTENDAFTSMSGNSGSGTGTIATQFAIDFRADVHPVVQTIDASPQPQNLTFTAPEGDSRATLTAFNGSFQTDDGKHSASFSLSPAAALMIPAPPPLAADTFDVGSLPGEPAACNNGSPGVQGGPSNVFCPSVGFYSANGGVCSDDDGMLCQSAYISPVTGFGLPTGGAGGLLEFTMDPLSYAISVTATSTSFTRNASGISANATATMNGTIDSPTYAPTNTTPSVRKPRPAARTDAAR